MPTLQETRDTLDSLEQIQDQMQTAEFRNWLRRQGNDNIRKITRKQADLLICIEEYRNRTLEHMVGKLQQDLPSLTAGISNLEREIQGLDNLSSFLSSISAVINTLANILDLVLPG